MQSTPAEIRTWHHPDPARIGNDHVEFLKILNEPTWLTFEGEDNSRSRAIITLLHGNEPSGLKSLHRWIKSGRKPVTRLGILIASVNAALQPPIFSHRYLPDERDLNRCFSGPFADNQGQLALAIMTQLKEFQPEAIVDTHNTSAHSEPFAIAVNDTHRTRQIAGLFTKNLIVIHRKMGALQEASTAESPVVTVEFGGFRDPGADLLADSGLEQFIHAQNLFETEPTAMQLLRDPRRLEIKKGHQLHYSSTVQEEADITLFNTIDQLNFKHVEAHTSLGWLGEDGLEGLLVTDEAGHNELHDFFYEKDGFLLTRIGIMIFMATTDAFVAEHDCLLYFTPHISRL